MEKEWDSKTGAVVWLYSNRHVNKLKRFGDIHYVSRKMDYVVLYIEIEKKEEILKKISEFHFVKKVEESFLQEMSMDFQQVLEEYRQEIQENGTPLFS